MLAGAFAVAAGLGSCGNDSSVSDDNDVGPTTTVAAPLRPDLRQEGSGGIGTIGEWAETWNTVNAILSNESSAFPSQVIDQSMFTLHASDNGLPVFAGQLGEVILGGSLFSSDGGISSLVLVGQPGDQQFLASYAVWIAVLDPTVDPQELLPLELAFGEDSSARAVVTANGRNYEAIRVVDESGLSVLAVSMVAGEFSDEQSAFGAHSFIRRVVLDAIGEA